MVRIRHFVSATFAVLALTSAFAAPAQAQIKLNTGINGGGSALADLASDPFWTISTDGGSTFSAAKVAAPGNPIICCGMEQLGGTSGQWISDPSIDGVGASTAWGIGPIVYARRSFDLTGYDLSSVTMAGFWRVADFRNGIYLNNVLFDAATADGQFGWMDNQAFSTSTGFVNGVNTLELRGSSLNSTWDGFYVDATVQGLSTVPEPASVALFAAGLAGLGMTVRRRNRRLGR